MIYVPSNDREIDSFLKIHFEYTAKEKSISAKTDIKNLLRKTHGTSVTARKSHCAVTQAVRLL